MPKCLLKYQWVKLPRTHLPQGKGVMGCWVRLASRAAFRKGQARYCGHTNDVTPGMWSGGVVGLKSILGVKSRARALEIMDELQSLGYIEYTLDPVTKKAGLLYQGLGRKVLRRRVHGRGGVYDRWLRLPLPSPQHHAAAGGAKLHIRRIRRMAGSMVPYHMAGSPQCVFFFGACRPVRPVGRRIDFGDLGAAMGLGEDKGMEIFSKAWGCLCSVPPSRRLWLSRF